MAAVPVYACKSDSGASKSNSVCCYPPMLPLLRLCCGTATIILPLVCARSEESASRAQLNLGVTCRGAAYWRIRRDAIKRLRLAADQNKAFAQHRFGEFYEADRSVPQNHVRAMSVQPVRRAGRRTRHRAPREADREFVRGQIAEAQKLAREWLASQSPTKTT